MSYRTGADGGSRTTELTPADRSLLLRLQRLALLYFIENQLTGGLFLDRQRNHGPRSKSGLCSTAATGMGLIALALATAPPYRLLSRGEAITRIRAALETAWARLPHTCGIMPHFVNPDCVTPAGSDSRSTIDSAWLLAGGLWAAQFLGDPTLEWLAGRLYDRVDWRYWTAPGSSGLLRHGAAPDGRILSCDWDRLNGETVHLYVLAAGATAGRALAPAAWDALRPCYGAVAELRFNNADLGLFVFQYGLDLLDLAARRPPGELDLEAEAAVAAEANCRACQQWAHTFRTYRRYWGLSAGDGPGAGGRRAAYRCYSPAGPIDGTAHLTATLASAARHPGAVLEQVRQAVCDRVLGACGRYGLSSVNLDLGWVGPDMIGIDAGAAVLALDNLLMAGRVREVFHQVSCVQAGCERLGFLPRAPTCARPFAPHPAGSFNFTLPGRGR
jgi:hypothetical protein